MRKNTIDAETKQTITYEIPKTIKSMYAPYFCFIDFLDSRIAYS